MIRRASENDPPGRGSYFLLVLHSSHQFEHASSTLLGPHSHRGFSPMTIQVLEIYEPFQRFFWTTFQESKTVEAVRWDVNGTLRHRTEAAV